MTTVSNLPAIPTRGAAGFGAAFEAVYVALKNNLVPQVNAVAGEVNAAAIAAALSASGASTSASTASAAADAATRTASAAADAATLSAGSSFKGAWSTLTGALAVPATVAHNGLTWVLLSDLTNVATATPGVSASWQCLQKGVIQVVAASTSTPFSTTSTSYVDAGLSAVITPKSSASKILALLSINSVSSTTNEAGGQLYRGAAALSGAFFYAGAPDSAAPNQFTIAVLDSPASTAALTYSVKVKMFAAGGAVSLSRMGGSSDSLILMEVL